MVHSVSEWFPDRPPMWWEIAVTVLFGFSVVPNLLPVETIAWKWILVGFVLTGVAVGPAGTTAVGKRFGQWFRNIGGAGRIAVIALLAVIIWGTTFTTDVPVDSIEGFVAGMWVALLVFILAHVVQAREIGNRKTG